jgi:predicted nucleic acid-binding Zn ribbon protein
MDFGDLLEGFTELGAELIPGPRKRKNKWRIIFWIVIGLLVIFLIIHNNSD